MSVNWTREIPTEPGHYWVRYKEGDIQIWKLEADGDFLQIGDEEAWGEYGIKSLWGECWWLKIEQPKFTALKEEGE